MTSPVSLHHSSREEKSWKSQPVEGYSYRALILVDARPLVMDSPENVLLVVHSPCFRQLVGQRVFPRFATTRDSLMSQHKLSH